MNWPSRTSYIANKIKIKTVQYIKSRKGWEKKEGNYTKTLHQDSGHSNFSDKRNADKLFTQTYRDLYGDAMLVPILMGTNMAAGNQCSETSVIEFY